jgi:hypothetical protein
MASPVILSSSPSTTIDDPKLMIRGFISERMRMLAGFKSI